MTVTCLMPGATETDFFEWADMLDTKVGQAQKMTPRMRGDGDVVSGWKNKLQSAIANVTPAGVLAEQHRRMAEPSPHGRAGVCRESQRVGLRAGEARRVLEPHAAQPDLLCLLA